MNAREYAKCVRFELVGKLKRIDDEYYGVDNRHYPRWIDEIGNIVGGHGDCWLIVTNKGKFI